MPRKFLKQIKLWYLKSISRLQRNAPKKASVKSTPLTTPTPPSASITASKGASVSGKPSLFSKVKKYLYSVSVLPLMVKKVKKVKLYREYKKVRKNITSMQKNIEDKFKPLRNIRKIFEMPRDIKIEPIQFFDEPHKPLKQKLITAKKVLNDLEVRQLESEGVDFDKKFKDLIRDIVYRIIDSPSVRKIRDPHILKNVVRNRVYSSIRLESELGKRYSRTQIFNMIDEVILEVI